jgi:hypothetical protein
LVHGLAGRGGLKMVLLHVSKMHAEAGRMLWGVHPIGDFREVK